LNNLVLESTRKGEATPRYRVFFSRNSPSPHGTFPLALSQQGANRVIAKFKGVIIFINIEYSVLIIHHGIQGTRHVILGFSFLTDGMGSIPPPFLRAHPAPPSVLPFAGCPQIDPAVPDRASGLSRYLLETEGFAFLRKQKLWFFYYT
jgi:hypothetical protein